MLFSIFINKYLKLLGAIPPMNKFMGFLALNCEMKFAIQGKINTDNTIKIYRFHICLE